MGSSLGPVLANVIMTELEKIVLPKLIEEGLIKHYTCYVDDALVMVKEDKIDEILERFNNFDQNLRFTVDSFDDGDVHFLIYGFVRTEKQMCILNQQTLDNILISTAMHPGDTKLPGLGP